MPLLYGEGVKAFSRLQGEIMKEIDNHSLFSWTVPEGTNQSWIVSGVFAWPPPEFAQSGNIIPIQEELGQLLVVTKKGLQINLDLQLAETPHRHRKHCAPKAFSAILNCALEDDITQRIALLLLPARTNQSIASFYRCAVTEHLVARSDDKFQIHHTIYIPKNVLLEFSRIFSSAFSKHIIPGQAYSNLHMLKRLYHLAFIVQYLGKLDKAEGLYRQISDGIGKDLGWEHPSTLECLSNLALVLQNLDKYEEAEALH